MDTGPKSAQPVKFGAMLSHWPLLLILALAAALRIYGLDARTLWTDELFSLQSSAARGFWVEDLPRGAVMDPAPRPTSLAQAGPLWAIYPTQNTDTNPPLYYMCLRLWREAFGDSTSALRSLSVVATLFTVIAMYAAGLSMGGRKVAVIAGLLCALSATQVLYAHEVRGYAMACAFVAVAAAALLRIERDGATPVRLSLLVAGATLGICTVYLAAMPVLAMGTHAAANLRGRDRLRTLAAGGLILVLTTLSVGPLLSHQRHFLGLRNQWMNAPAPRTAGEVCSEAAVDVLTQLAVVQERSGGFAELLGWALVLGAIPLYWFVRPARLWLVWVALSIGALMVMDLAGQKTHLRWLRYTMLAGPGVIGIAASLATTAKSKFGWLVPAALALFAAVSVPATYETELGKKEDWTVLRKFVASAHVRDDDLWVVAAYGMRRWDHILYLGLSRCLPTPEMRAVIVDDPAQVSSALRDSIERQGRMVLFSEAGTNATSIVPPGWQVKGTALFPIVGSLTLYERPGPSTNENPRG